MRGYVLDGYPRYNKEFDQFFVGKEYIPDFYFELDTAQDVIKQRMSKAYGN